MLPRWGYAYTTHCVSARLADSGGAAAEQQPTFAVVHARLLNTRNRMYIRVVAGTSASASAIVIIKHLATWLLDDNTTCHMHRRGAN